MRRWAGLAVAVIVAMVVGQLLTDHVAVGEVAVRPFVRSGVIGKPVHLTYADVTVTGVRATHLLSPSTASTALPLKPGGVYLLVDLKLDAKKEDTQFFGIFLADRDGTRYLPTRRANCAFDPTAVTGVPRYSTVCFDVPHSALVGMHVVVARGDLPDDQLRRDDQADVDLGIDKAKAAADWASKKAYRSFDEGFHPGSTEPLTLVP